MGAPEGPDRTTPTTAADAAARKPLAGISHARWKRADTTSAVGAGVLGVGIGLFLDRFLGAYAVPIVALGLVMHSWGMYDKHRLESGATGSRLWWAEALYWGCWLGLLALGLYAALAVL